MVSIQALLQNNLRLLALGSTARIAATNEANGVEFAWSKPSIARDLATLGIESLSPSSQNNSTQEQDLPGVYLIDERYEGESFSRSCLRIADIAGSEFLGEGDFRNADLSGVTASEDTTIDCRWSFEGALIEGIKGFCLEEDYSNGKVDLFDRCSITIEQVRQTASYKSRMGWDAGQCPVGSYNRDTIAAIRNSPEVEMEFCRNLLGYSGALLKLES